MKGRPGRSRIPRGRPFTPAPGRRLRNLLSGRSVAGQVFFLQVVLMLLLVAGLAVLLVVRSRNDIVQDARHRSLAAAEAFAHSPGMVGALTGANPTAVLQPLAEEVRKGTGVDLIVVYSPRGIRFTDRDPRLIGKHVLGPGGPPGKPVTSIITTTSGPSVVADVPVTKADGAVVGGVAVGITVDTVNSVINRQLPTLLGAAAGALVLATGSSALVSRRLRRQTRGLGPTEMTRMYEHHDAVLHSVREGVLVIGGESGAGARLLLANDEARRLLGLSPAAEGSRIADLGLPERTTELLASERVASDEVLLAGDRLLAINVRPIDGPGGPAGSVATLRDSTELRALTGRAEVARGRLQLLYDAGAEIGTTLDVVRTAEELAEVTVPRFADIATVDLADSVLSGEEPEPGAGTRSATRRIAVRSVRGDPPLFRVGELITWVSTTPEASGLGSGHAVLVPSLHASPHWRGQDPDHADEILDAGIHSLISVPLQARGVNLGVANFWRTEKPAFEEEDLPSAEELAARAAVCIDNARRYTREHTMVVTLQRSLLPRALPEQSALEIAYRYLPAQAGVGGDWFDVIPLPGARVALVVGDVVGHGLHAAATMGRLRTAVHNFSALDLPPDELLAHLDELVARIDSDEAGDGAGVTGATCLYAIYDPVSRWCTLARAGHPGPALVRPGGAVTFPELPTSPPLGLGLGTLPFESAALQLPEASQLVLFTDGLVEDRERDIGTGLELLRAALAHPDRAPEETCQAVFDAVLPARPSDDVALLVARTRVLPSDQVAVWDVPSDPAAVSGVRAEVAAQLESWGLTEIGFTTELILSELVTNAIRYGRAPIRVRLLRDRNLICEVSDSSSTSPHLRYAATTDEGGRGLFLVAQLARRWGTRYTATGKVIWSEQPLHDEPAP